MLFFFSFFFCSADIDKKTLQIKSNKAPADASRRGQRRLQRRQGHQHGLLGPDRSAPLAGARVDPHVEHRRRPGVGRLEPRGPAKDDERVLEGRRAVGQVLCPALLLLLLLLGDLRSSSNSSKRSRNRFASVDAALRRPDRQVVPSSASCSSSS